MHINLQKDMCRSWVGRKAVLQLNSNDELGRFLLGLAEIPAPLFQSVPHKEIGTFSSNS